jgi:hypothetical protein
MRLHAQTAPFENGAVFLPGDAPWLADYVNELTGFPGSRYADQVDTSPGLFANHISKRLMDQSCRLGCGRKENVGMGLRHAARSLQYVLRVSGESEHLD